MRLLNCNLLFVFLFFFFFCCLVVGIFLGKFHAFFVSDVVADVVEIEEQ